MMEQKEVERNWLCAFILSTIQFHFHLVIWTLGEKVVNLTHHIPTVFWKDSSFLWKKFKLWNKQKTRCEKNIEKNMSFRVQISGLIILLSELLLLCLVQSKTYNNGLIFYNIQTNNWILPPALTIIRTKGFSMEEAFKPSATWASQFGPACDCSQKVLCRCCVGLNIKEYKYNEHG